MQRGRNKAVTGFPILIPTTPQKAEGFAAFQGKKNNIGPVRALRSNDLEGSRKSMSEHEAKHFSAITLLIQALGKVPDLLAITRAGEHLSEAYSLKIKSDETAGRSFQPFPERENAEEERTNFARSLTELLSIPAGTDVRALLKAEKCRDPRWLLSYEVSKALKDTKLVLWWNGESFKPAIWCPELKIAFYARAVMGTLRICPHCSEPFAPERPDQDYCSVAHREAHRVA
ncbi:MAG TPA: hypothetical protein VKZ53_02840, partial [Candidatus Angelobacter sp.]|nr:hypothetical protein [Candidatus Angelobacter sp.]